MIKKIYRIIILNDRTRFNKTINLNQNLIFIFSIVIIIIIFLASFGMYRILYPHPKQTEYNILLNNKRDTINLLYYLTSSNMIDSTLLTNYKLKDFFNNDTSLIPNKIPVQGIVTRGLDFIDSPTHNGVDIAAKFNTNVNAAQQGLIIFTGTLDKLGNTVIISHPNNYFTFYSHLNKIFVSSRNYVNAKDPIGTIGQSGNSDGPHLHFEIWKNSTIIDPRELIEEYKLNDVSIKNNLQ